MRAQELAARNAAGGALGPLHALRGTPQAGFSGRTPCEFLHPGVGCNRQSVNFLPQAYLRALPVYAPGSLGALRYLGLCAYLGARTAYAPGSAGLYSPNGFN